MEETKLDIMFRNAVVKKLGEIVGEDDPLKMYCVLKRLEVEIRNVAEGIKDDANRLYVMEGKPEFYEGYALKRYYKKDTYAFSDEVEKKEKELEEMKLKEITDGTAVKLKGTGNTIFTVLK